MLCHGRRPLFVPGAHLVYPLHSLASCIQTTYFSQLWLLWTHPFKGKTDPPSDMVCTTQAKTGFKSALVFLRSPPCSDFSVEFLLVTCLSSLTCKNATFSFASRLDLVALFLWWQVLDIMKTYFSGSVSSAIACPTDVMKIRMQARLAKLRISFSNRNDQNLFNSYDPA